MQTIGDILKTVFTSAFCDFCPAFGPTYTDPETQGRYCLPCLVLAVEAEQTMTEDLPEDPHLTSFAREYIAASRTAA